MSGSTAIGMVSESLRNLLVREMALDIDVNITILAPDESGPEPRVNLFLYKIMENPTLRNLDWQPNRGAPNRIAPPPLSLNLYYLMTPYATNDAQTGNATAHMILGEAMRILYENPVLRATPIDPPVLVDGLADAREQIKIVLNTLDVEELSQVWGTFAQPYRLSVLYEVSVVQLDPLPAAARPLANRVRRIGVPDVQAPYQPPVVSRVTPSSTGGASFILTLHGENLAGWRAYITCLDHTLTPSGGLALTADDTFTVNLPAALAEAPGFYEVRVDISHLFRRTFVFEVVES